MQFAKYHALGNDYLVMSAGEAPTSLSADQIRRICHRNFGIGSDGILLGPLPSSRAAYGLRIFNPDGSEAEKSGNGLRIFSRYLWDRGLVRDEEFAIETPGGVVRASVLDQGRQVRVDMGRVSFDSTQIPVTGAAREVLNETLDLGGKQLVFSAATIGNPHCVVPVPETTEALARELGPQLETHPLFPRRTNVQFAQRMDRANLRIEIWERGAGYTLASGSSSSAAAAVAHRLGWVDRLVTVHMPGGQLDIEIAEDYSIRMTGPVTKVAEGRLDPEIFDR